MQPDSQSSLEYFRLFVAIQVPEQAKKEIERAQTTLRTAVPDARIRWTRPEQFHLTLKFLGDLEATRTTSLTQDLRQRCQSFTPLRLRAERIGCFPNARLPRVIWVGIQERSNLLLPLYQAISNATQQYMTHEDRDTFDGHITLGRVKAIKRREAQTLSKAATDSAHNSFGEWTADQIELMRSELLPEGARHTCLAVIPLLKEPSSVQNLS